MEPDIVVAVRCVFGLPIQPMAGGPHLLRLAERRSIGLSFQEYDHDQ
jgi:hypothetical protein